MATPGPVGGKSRSQTPATAVCGDSSGQYSKPVFACRQVFPKQVQFSERDQVADSSQSFSKPLPFR